MWRIKTDILIYQLEDGKTKIDVRLEDETVWMSQKTIAELYQKGVNTINEHIKNIYAVGYRVRSSRGTQFRRWATERLNEYLVKGFTMDDERLQGMRNSRSFSCRTY